MKEKRVTKMQVNCNVTGKGVVLANVTGNVATSVSSSVHVRFEEITVTGNRTAYKGKVTLHLTLTQIFWSKRSTFTL